MIIDHALGDMINDHHDSFEPYKRAVLGVGRVKPRVTLGFWPWVPDPANLAGSGTHPRNPWVLGSDPRVGRGENFLEVLASLRSWYPR